MSDFVFATSGRIIFGPGRAARELPALAAGLGRRPFVCTGAHPDRHAGLLASLGPAAITWPVAEEPTVEGIRAGVRAARDHRADLVVGLGGGAVIDAAKLIAVLVASSGDVLDYAEVIGGGAPLPARSLPTIAVPTTAGTGSEVTSNGVVASPEHEVKVSLRSPSMLPAVALVDPELTLGCPPAVTASSGLDALTQCLEPFVTPAATPITDALSAEGLRRVGTGLRRAYADGSDLDARNDLSLAALLSGMALANARLGAVHGFAGPIGGMTGAPHGAVCAAVLAATCRTNVQELTRLDPGHPALQRYATAGGLLSGHSGIEPLLEWIDQTVALLAVPGLVELGLPRARFAEACEKAAMASSMKGNPVTLDRAQLLGILEASA
jgi:alcohol dehydrogenase class IV